MNQRRQGTGKSRSILIIHSFFNVIIHSFSFIDRQIIIHKNFVSGMHWEIKAVCGILKSTLTNLKKCYGIDDSCMYDDK